MLSNKSYVSPVTDVFKLSPKDRMLWENEGTSTMPGPIIGGAPMRFPEDN